MCPTYASKYQDLIKRMASKLQVSESGVIDGSSYEINGEEETNPPIQELHSFVIDAFIRIAIIYIDFPFKLGSYIYLYKTYIYYRKFEGTGRHDVVSPLLQIYMCLCVLTLL